MDSRDIERQLARTRGFIGVFPLDTFPTNMPQHTGAIINLDTSDGPGSHWVGVFKSILLEWYDPLGLPPPDNLVYPRPILYNKKRIQDEASIACGAFAVDFVRRRLRGEDFTSIQHTFSHNTLFNDLLL